jgi:hypothetical protein
VVRVGFVLSAGSFLLRDNKRGGVGTKTLTYFSSLVFCRAFPTTAERVCGVSRMLNEPFTTSTITTPTTSSQNFAVVSNFSPPGRALLRQSIHSHTFRIIQQNYTKKNTAVNHSILTQQPATLSTPYITRQHHQPNNKMNRTLAFVIVALFTACSVSEAFAPQPRSVVSSIQSNGRNTFQSTSVDYFTMGSISTSTTTTSLNLKIKVDPEKAKSKGINPGLAKGAAYGGSIVVAVLLPVIFLAWSAFSH